MKIWPYYDLLKSKIEKEGYKAFYLKQRKIDRLCERYR